MQNIICKLVLFRPAEDSILSNVAALFRQAPAGVVSSEIVDKACLQLRRMVDLADSLSLEGNLWHNYLTWFLLTDENPFTLSREYAPDRADSLSRLAKKDMTLLQELFRYDLSSMGRNLLGIDCFDDLSMTGCSQKVRGAVGALVSDMARNLAAAPTVDAFYDLLVSHYALHGVGSFGMGHAFRVEEGSGTLLRPIYNEDPVCLNDLVGGTRLEPVNVVKQ